MPSENCINEAVKCIEPVSAEIIRSYLPEIYKGCEIKSFPSVDSTNTRAKLLARDNATHGTMLVSEEQTGGRGRYDRQFFSPKGTGIYMSLILHMNREQGDAQMLTVAAAVAVCEAIEGVARLSPSIKWVNDLYLHGRKICGILAETVGNGNAVVGVGLNCTTTEFPEELRDKAGSIGQAGISRNLLIAGIAEGILKYADMLSDPFIIREYKKRSLIIGKKILFEMNGNSFCASALDINEKGNLVVKTPSGERHTLSSGEVTITEEF